MGVKFSNNAYGTLNGSITTSDTSLTLASGQGARFPTLAAGDYFYATLIDTSNNLEIIKVTGRTSDVLTIVRAQENTLAKVFSIGDRVELRITGAGLEDAANPYDKNSTSTGSFGLPNGTTAQEPAAADSVGHIRYDTDLGTVTFSDGTQWYKIAAAIAQLSSVSGTIYTGVASTLTLTGTGFLTANLIVNFKQVSDSIDTNVTVTPTSDTSATVSVPSAVYSNVTVGNTVDVKVTNSDGMSSAAIGKTAVGLPSGGTIASSGGYRYHKFTSSGTFTVPSGFSASMDYLIVAGGGGGGDNHGGGGGAGGLLQGTGTISSGSYSVTVGAGGNYGHYPTSGGNSSVSGWNTAVGGGSGGSGDPGQAPASGGSGGGAGGHSTPTFTGASGTSGQGNSGGNGLDSGSTIKNGGGGGGKGAAGQSAGSGYAGDGGNGTNAYSTWASATSSGDGGYYAGGGGAGCWTDQGQTPGTGGLGGGGDGGQAGGVQGQAGQANTGGGGGGGDDGQGLAGNGGSGIVIIRYQI